ncbi:cytochrome P450 [Pholiota conissans]|uniref:Cytochrome P450 n=1 Tax=Pholiota conissans TaxID=109636 RepID=A0A9P5Z8H0_9AGAR|nr:cytochrome P450 [Pholiota conissans]
MALSDLTVSILLAIGPLAGILFGIYTSYISWLDSPFRKVTYPPGPSQSGLLRRSLRDVPSSRPWTTYAEWALKYGNIIYFKLKGKPMIILNSIDDAHEMFERRCGVYSDRPKDIMNDLMGWDFHTQLMPYGAGWRGHRKLYQQCFRPKAAAAYTPIQTRKVRNLLNSLLTSPDEFRTHCKTASTGVIFSILYGEDLPQEMNEYFASLGEEAVFAYSKGPLAASNIVNAFPILRHLPPWFPGAEFHRLALEVKKATSLFLDAPLDFIGEGLLDGTVTPSLMVDLMENCYMERDFDRIKHVAATTYLAGTDTMTSPLLSFFLAMAKFPDAQKKAQAEITRVIGPNRLPTYEDRASLPYVEALYREVLRWRPPVPLNTAHVTTEADIYNGFHIPKGAQIVANIWAMTRDEGRYADPESFKPERFLDGEGALNNDDLSLIFGFGRRICPGRHIASATVWLTVTSVLATFDIMKQKGISDGVDDLNMEYTNGPVSQPLPFSCSITPRNGKIASLIREVS